MGRGRSALTGPLALSAAALLAGCMQSAGTGDLGRPGPSAEPTSAYFAARSPAFNETDKERELKDRVWRFLHAQHTTGWFDAKLPVVGRTLTPAEHAEARAAYHRWLTRTEYASSRIRFRTVADDISADLDTLPATFEAICAVIEVDRQRGIAVAELGGLDDGVAANVRTRKARNAADAATFTAALAFRYDAYAYALDHLLVATPHEEAVDANRVLGALATYVDRAESGRFCEAGGVYIVLPEDDDVIPGRIGPRPMRELPF